MTKRLQILLVILFSIIVYIYYSNSNKTLSINNIDISNVIIENTKVKDKNTSFSKIKENNNENIKIEKEIQIKDNNIPNYKDIFKEEKKDTLKDMQESQELKKLEQDTNSLINEADKFIKSHNLVVPTINLSKDEQEKVEKNKEELQKLTNQLEEL